MRVCGANTRAKVHALDMLRMLALRSFASRSESGAQDDKLFSLSKRTIGSAKALLSTYAQRDRADSDAAQLTANG